MTDKRELITLYHSSDSKAKVTVNADHAQTYLDSGWAEKPVSDDTK